MSSRLPLSLLVALVSLVSPTLVVAVPAPTMTTVVSNLDNAYINGANFGYSSYNATQYLGFQPFTTGAAETGVGAIGSIAISANMGGESAYPAVITAQIYQFEGITAGSSLVPSSFTPVGAAMTASITYPTSYYNVTFTPTSGLSLQPNTRYLLGVSAVVSGNPTANCAVYWGVTANTSVTGANGWALTSGTVPNDSCGSHYSTQSSSWLIWNGAYKMSISVIPEPSTYAALAGAGALVVAVALRRTRARRQQRAAE